jgi:hypothetical protein
MTGQEFNWVEAAVRYHVGNSRVHLLNNGQVGREIYIQAMRQIDNSLKWAVYMGDYFVLGKDLKYHFQPIPSSGTEKFLANTRFDTKEQALQKLVEYETTYQDNLEEPVLTIE